MRSFAIAALCLATQAYSRIAGCKMEDNEDALSGGFFVLGKRGNVMAGFKDVNEGNYSVEIYDSIDEFEQLGDKLFDVGTFDVAADPVDPIDDDEEDEVSSDSDSDVDKAGFKGAPTDELSNDAIVGKIVALLDVTDGADQGELVTYCTIATKKRGRRGAKRGGKFRASGKLSDEKRDLIKENVRAQGGVKDETKDRIKDKIRANGKGRNLNDWEQN